MSHTLQRKIFTEHNQDSYIAIWLGFNLINIYVSGKDAIYHEIYMDT